MNLLSPTEVGKQLDELNRPYNCAICGEPGKNPEERKFIKALGSCYSCDSVKADVQGEELEMARLDAQDQANERHYD